MLSRHLCMFVISFLWLLGGNCVGELVNGQDVMVGHTGLTMSNVARCEILMCDQDNKRPRKTELFHFKQSWIKMAKSDFSREIKIVFAYSRQWLLLGNQQSLLHQYYHISFYFSLFFCDLAVQGLSYSQFINCWLKIYFDLSFSMGFCEYLYTVRTNLPNLLQILNCFLLWNHIYLIIGESISPNVYYYFFFSLLWNWNGFGCSTNSKPISTVLFRPSLAGKSL